MSRVDVLKIIIDEKLRGCNYLTFRPLQENEMVLREENNKFVVFATDERASCVTNSESCFDNEEDANDNFIKRLRALNRVMYA